MYMRRVHSTGMRRAVRMLALLARNGSTTEVQLDLGVVAQRIQSIINSCRLPSVFLSSCRSTSEAGQAGHVDDRGTVDVHAQGAFHRDASRRKDAGDKEFVLSAALVEHIAILVLNEHRRRTLALRIRLPTMSSSVLSSTHSELVSRIGIPRNRTSGKNSVSMRYHALELS
jgi:hypothetical protein